MEDYSENTKPLDKNLVLALFKSGLRQIDIAKYFGCVKSTISIIIKNYV